MEYRGYAEVSSDGTRCGGILVRNNSRDSVIDALALGLLRPEGVLRFSWTFVKRSTLLLVSSCAGFQAGELSS